MAETAKILNPEKTVLLPSLQAGCSLAESITAEDVRELKQRFPGVPVVCYVNTYASVKAECDICCTSSNAARVVESLNSKSVIFIPDEYLAKNVAKETNMHIIFPVKNKPIHPDGNLDYEMIGWEGRCEVHEKFTPGEIGRFRDAVPGLTVIAHPECPPEVLDASDYTGSTAQMIDFVGQKKPENILMVTECSMSDNLTSSFPDVNFIRPCNMCPHMKLITLGKVLKSMEDLGPAVEISNNVAERARFAVEQMLAVK